MDNVVLGFAVILKQERLKKGLSQEELALGSGLDRTYISLIERGKRNPTIKTIFTLCDTLEIKPSYLVERIESELEQPS